MSPPTSTTGSIGGRAGCRRVLALVVCFAAAVYPAVLLIAASLVGRTQAIFDSHPVLLGLLCFVPGIIASVVLPPSWRLKWMLIYLLLAFVFYVPLFMFVLFSYACHLHGACL